LPSTTQEEAPAFIDAWLRQRRRWSKGWMRPVNVYFCSRVIKDLVHI
jgi:cellulose synthase/poly-beta-1,6-N-acetylglucosamine synthase-like glycosyltransferase